MSSEWESAQSARIVSKADLAVRALLLDATALLWSRRGFVADRMAVMRDALAGQPRGTNFDAAVVSGGRSVIWCWVHERDVAACHAARLLCDGEPIDTNDPTGETALRPDRAARDRTQLDRHVRALHRHAEAIVAVLDSYELRPPTKAERRGTAQAGQLGCQSCARTKGADDQPRYEPHAVRSTNAKGVLDRPMAMCTWCYRFTMRMGRLPSTREITAHHRGQRVRTPAAEAS